MPHKITLVKTRQGCAIAEVHPRYNVLLNGQKVDQLCFNMTGYVGTLPLPGGRKLSIGERGISAFRKEASLINREAKEDAQ